MESSGITVGTVNIIVHCSCLVTLAIAGGLAKRCIRRFTILRLNKHGSAAVMHDTIVSHLGSIASLRHLFHTFSPGITAVVLISILAVPTEFYADMGVAVSERCSPIRIRSEGVCADALESRNSPGTKLDILRNTGNWDGEDIVKNPIYEGFRRNIDGNEYFGPDIKRDPKLPIVIEGCRVSPSRLLPPINTTSTLYTAAYFITLDIWV